MAFSDARGYTCVRQPVSGTALCTSNAPHRSTGLQPCDEVQRTTQPAKQSGCTTACQDSRLCESQILCGTWLMKPNPVSVVV